MPSLVVAGGRSHFIIRKLTSLGSDPDNDIQLADDMVAPTHAHLKLDGGRFLLVGLSRAFPIRVNGKKVRKQVLDHGDEVSIGEARLTFNLWDETGTIEARTVVDPRAEELTAYRRLAAFSEVLAGHDDVEALLETLMDQVVALTRADKGFLLLVEGGEIQVRTARNVNQETFAANLDQVSDSIISRVMKTREPIIVSDALNDGAFKSSVSVMQLRLCSVMCVPLLFGGNLLGVIYVGNDNIVNLFEAESLAVLSVFAGQASLLLANAVKRAELKQDNERLRAALEGRRFGDLIGACDAMMSVFRRVEKVSRTDVNVLIRGETGTGKELIAREVHARSGRSEGPFIAVNCGAIPENLMESELFGHRRGAFTGAIEDKKGSFQAAHGGTLFLDEIGEMPARLQVKLLRAIQERTVTRVGDSKPTPVNIRILAATHVDLETAIGDGRFREDLYYRLNVVGIALPPLRERDEDIVLLAQYLLDRLAEEYGREIGGFTPEALIALRKYPWPGNIRELENRLKKAVILADDGHLSADDLDLDEDVISDQILPLAQAKDAFQRRYIDRVLALNNGNRTKTARDLGVDPRTVFRHLERVRDTDE